MDALKALGSLSNDWDNFLRLSIYLMLSWGIEKERVKNVSVGYFIM